MKILDTMKYRPWMLPFLKMWVLTTNRQVWRDRIAFYYFRIYNIWLEFRIWRNDRRIMRMRAEIGAMEMRTKEMETDWENNSK